MFLIKKSTVFDRNIKFEENVNFDKKIKFDEIVKFDEKVKFDKNVNISSTSPTSSHPLDVVSHFFWTKKKFWQTKRKLTLPCNSNSLVWMLSWQHQQLQGENISCNTADG